MWEGNGGGQLNCCSVLQQQEWNEAESINELEKKEM